MVPGCVERLPKFLSNRGPSGKPESQTTDLVVVALSSDVLVETW